MVNVNGLKKGREEWKAFVCEGYYKGKWVETFIPAHPNAFLKIYTVGPLVTEKLSSFFVLLGRFFPLEMLLVRVAS